MEPGGGVYGCAVPSAYADLNAGLDRRTIKHIRVRSDAGNTAP